MKHLNILYIVLVGLIFSAFVVVFDTFPRSTVSELEKRELASFRPFSFESLRDGSFTRDISSWFSDSEPYRDQLMTLSMSVKDLIRVTTGDDQVTFHASSDAPVLTEEEEEPLDTVTHPDSYENHLTADENAKIANAGIIIVGSGPNLRALMAYGGGANGGTNYAEAVNRYKETFPSVNVYCMVIPMSTDFYIPDKVRSRSRPQRPTIENVYAHLSSGVKAVDIYYIMGDHAEEPIYLRTDHHWAPLGAYYAAQEFARVAGVPFRDLGSYERHVVHGYVGSMYGYSKDISVKQSPEDFVYYTPKGVDYQTTYVNYSIDSTYHVIGESRPVKGPFFYKYRDGSGGAYCTFMGGDTKITQVKTSTHNGRRLLILKDSFGNAVPGYLFYSFEEVHVIDDRYFTKNMVAYVQENQITDILFANNTFNVYSVYRSFLRYLTQSGGIPHRPAEPSAAPDSTATASPQEGTQPTETTDPVAVPTEPVQETSVQSVDSAENKPL